MESAKFRLKEVVILLFVAGMVFSLLLPVLAENIRTSRMAVCSNNLKLIGVGLEMWRKNAMTGRYPTWDMPILASGGDLGPWCEMIGMVYPFTLENIEANRFHLEYSGMPPEDFSKTVDSMKIFRCPADHPHPHRINQERADAWSFNPLEYSYTLCYALAKRSGYPIFAKDPSSQVLSADGVWTWSHNFSGYYVDDPDNPFNDPNSFCNTVGYFHQSDSANFVLRDGHVENHRWDPQEGLPDTQDVYFGEPGESYDAFYF